MGGLTYTVIVLQQNFPVPIALTEATNTWYSVPGTRSVTSAGDDRTMNVLSLSVTPLTLYRILYPVMGNSPLDTVGVIHDILIIPTLLTATARTVLGLGWVAPTVKKCYKIVQFLACNRGNLKLENNL